MKKLKQKAKQKPNYDAGCEEIALSLEFYEKRILGEKETKIALLVTQELNDGGFISEETTYKSLSALKDSLPTFKDVLLDIFTSHKWFDYYSSGRRTRVMFAKEIKGNDGLYEDTDIVVYNDEIRK